MPNGGAVDQEVKLIGGCTPLKIRLMLFGRCVGVDWKIEQVEPGLFTGFPIVDFVGWLVVVIEKGPESRGF